MRAWRAGGKVERTRKTPLPHQGEALDHILAALRENNRAKGSDIGSLAPVTGQYCRLFSPRIDRWDEHFALDGSQIVGRTDVAQVTIKILRLNDPERIAERALLQQIAEYPR